MPRIRVPKRTRPVPAAAVAATLVALAATAVLADSTPWQPGETGEWKLVWSVSEAVGFRNEFPDLGLEIDFPIPWKRLDDSRGVRLARFDAIGRAAHELPLEDGANVLASRDGSVHVRWSADRTDRRIRHVSYWRTGADAPDWEASAEADPCLIAPDGGLVLLKARGAEAIGKRGRLQIVGAEGDVREELDFAPLRAVMTVDGQRLVLLRPKELIVFDREGALVWSVRLPIDDVPARHGARPIVCGENRIAVCGTGEGRAEFRGGLYMPRRGYLRVFDGDGRLLWKKTQQDKGEVWFAASIALSADGRMLAFVRSGAEGTRLSLHDGADGTLLWEKRLERRVGFLHVSMTPRGDRVALVHGDARTHAAVWSAAGEPIFEGTLPYRAKTVALVDEGLLVADRWVVRVR